MKNLDSTYFSSIPATELSSPAQLCKKPLVSVLMMTRNHEKYVGDAIKSVMTQICDFEIELIIGENCSSDGTFEVCQALSKRFPESIRLITAENDVGITANFLRLAHRARGEFIAFLEGDDLWLDNSKLQTQVLLMGQNPQYSWCATRTENRTFWADPKESFNDSDILRRYIFHTSSVLFRSALVRQYPSFPDALCWESMLFAYLSKFGDCGFIDQTTSYYRRHLGGLWTGAELNQKQEVTNIFTDTMNAFFNEKFKVELADRELWITKLNTNPQIDSWNLDIWAKNRKAVIQKYRRTAFLRPFQFFRLLISVYLQPMSVSWRRLRRRAALRERFAFLFKPRH